MRDVQRVAIVDPSDATREELRKVLLGIESVWLEASALATSFSSTSSVSPARTW